MKVAVLEVCNLKAHPLILTECGAIKYRNGDKVKVAAEMVEPMQAMYPGLLKRVGDVSEQGSALANNHWEPVSAQKVQEPEVKKPEPKAVEQEVMGGNKSMAGKKNVKSKDVNDAVGNAG